MHINLRPARQPRPHSIQLPRQSSFNKHIQVAPSLLAVCTSKKKVLGKYTHTLLGSVCEFNKTVERRRLERGSTWWRFFSHGQSRCHLVWSLALTQHWEQWVCKHVQRSKLRHCVAAVRCYANYTGLVGFPQRLEPQNQPTPNQSVPIKPSKPLRENFCWKLFLY